MPLDTCTLLKAANARVSSVVWEREKDAETRKSKRLTEKDFIVAFILLVYIVK
jgi:hypothetical protein